MKRSLAFLLLGALGGCFLLEATSPLLAKSYCDWYEIRPVRRPMDEISNTVRERLIHLGYTIPDFSPRSGRIESDWVVNLSPRYRDGFRTKMEIEIEPLETGGFNVRVRSWREFNDQGKAPYDISKAQWVGAGMDERHAAKMPEPAMRLHQILKLRFFGISDD